MVFDLSKILQDKTVVGWNLSNSVSKIVQIHAGAAKRRGKLLKTLILKLKGEC